MNAFSRQGKARQGKALPIEVRNNIVGKWLNNEGIANISRQLNLPYKTVSNIVDLWVDNGDIEPRQPHRGASGTARTDDVITYIEYLKTNKPSIYGKEIQQELQSNNVCLPENVPNRSSISRVLKADVGWSYKQISQIARETERPDVMEKLENYIADISGIDCNRLHFFDESSVVVTSGNRRRGHSAIGTPAIEVQRYASNATYTVNLLHNIRGVSHFNILRGPSNGLELLNFFEEALEQEDVFANPVIKEHDVIIMDN
ncbi:paired box Pax-5-like [Paramuricea clavata]|uniref:Paired box Pax-5-like n=1 Tax=Paramuricea clavata TaxID=317549 RepID=A0A6S7H8X9_PARCT|nr:paired box Pax-5-like [Paramuricea clavata]